MTQPDFYLILNLPRSATKAEIRLAYIKLSKTHHPDAGGSPEEFSLLN
jgi:curved DNA-binding protein